MKERGEKIIGQREKDDALMNFVSRQAQDAILDPNLSEPYKDEVLNAAIGTILRIAERRNAYGAQQGQGDEQSQPYSIYEAK